MSQILCTAVNRTGDDCIACHMPKTNAVTVQHAVLTDHTIPRRPPRKARSIGASQSRFSYDDVLSRISHPNRWSDVTPNLRRTFIFAEITRFTTIIYMPGRLNPTRTIAELKELRSLTADENGAQRVAFTPTWAKARKWLRQKLEALSDVEIHNDAAGNLWATLRGGHDQALLIGGHIDSVPNGGWLDGCLNTLAGVEVLRRVPRLEDRRVGAMADARRGRASVVA